MKKVLLTGATGFVGRELLSYLEGDREISVRAAIRRNSCNLPSYVSYVDVGDLNKKTDWKAALFDIDVVIHTVGRAHIIKETSSNPIKEFRSLNVDATLALVYQAAEMGVKRFVYLSSIGVNGNQSRRPFTENDLPRPVGAYAISKYEAELALQAFSNEVDIEIVIIRPPLVYGVNAPGNFGLMLRTVYKIIPLPFGAINNKRSFVAIENLVDFIITCCKHPKAANQVFLISDGEDLSTTDMLKKLAIALEVPSILLPIHILLLKLAGVLFGKRKVILQLSSSLQVDISKAKILLSWVPIVSIDEALKITARKYMDQQND